MMESEIMSHEIRLYEVKISDHTRKFIEQVFRLQTRPNHIKAIRNC